MDCRNNFLKNTKIIPLDEYNKGMRLRLLQKTGWTEKKMNKVINEYFRFISLIILHNKGKMKIEVTPSIDIDKAWHNHMLFTRSYIEFCNKWYGDYIHHQPSYNKDGSRPGGYNTNFTREENEKILQDAFIQTRNTYKLFYNENPPEDIWGSVGECCSPCNGIQY